MNRYEKQKLAIEKAMGERVKEYQAIYKKADDEGRDPTEDERLDVESHLKAIEALKVERAEAEEQIKTLQRVSDIGRELGSAVEPEFVARGNGEPARPKQQTKSFGEQFVESKAYQDRRDNGFTGRWTTGHIALDTKATLLEGDLGTPGAGAPLIPYDQRPGVQPILFNRLTIANLLASGVTASNVVRYVVETTATNAAASVAEGGTKPESALAFDQVDEPVRKIATFLPVSDEMLEDAAQIQAYINARLSLFVQQEEEDQLLNGAGAGSDINGLLARVPVGNRGEFSPAAGATALDHIFQGLTVARQSYLEPDGVVINPVDWAEIRTLKDGNGSYMGGSPYSNGSEPAETLWGKRVVVTSAVVAGTALVGAFGQAAQVFRRGGLTVEASNSHADFFRSNLTAIRAEERLALAVYRPEAFATVDLNGAAT